MRRFWGSHETPDQEPLTTKIQILKPLRGTARGLRVSQTPVTAGLLEKHDTGRARRLQRRCRPATPEARRRQVASHIAHCGEKETLKMMSGSNKILKKVCIS